MQTSTHPRFCPVAQLLAAGEYAKHGWTTVDDMKSFRATIEKSAEDRINETYNRVEGKVTANDIAKLMNVSESCARRRLNTLVDRGMIKKAKRHVEGKPPSAKEFVFFKK